MKPHSKVYPSDEVISHKSVDLGPCIVITPRNLDSAPLGQDAYYPNKEARIVQECEKEDNILHREMSFENKSPCKEKLKPQSPVDSEHKVNVNYSYAPQSPDKAQLVSVKIPDMGPLPQKYLSFGSRKPVVLPDAAEDDFRRKSVVSKDFSTGIE